ncbi:MAG: hypothetical protein KDC80_10345 [Saprospiraceae bacterium]|nr:hypothetical protein [Saprospiraceae bacterium]
MFLKILTSTTIAGLITAGLSAQNSGMGTLLNYHYACTDGSSCTDQSNPSQSFIVTAPQDGQLTITATLTNGNTTCCQNQSYGGVVNGRVRKTTNNDIIQSFAVNATSNVVIDCVQKDETFLVEFDGPLNNTRGDFEFSIQIDPPTTSNDVEPNDIADQAKYIAPSINHEGRVGFGYYQDDDRDWYKIASADSGDIIINVTFDQPMNIYIHRNDNNQVIYSSLNPTGGNAIIPIPCTIKGDTFLIEIEQRLNFCIEYYLQYLVTPRNASDKEPNDTKATAWSIPNNLGKVEGDVGDGYYPKNTTDYLEIGTMQTGDSLRFKFNISTGPINVSIIRNSGSQVVASYGNLSGMVTKDLIIPATDQYFIALTSASCSHYEIDISGLISYVRINGVDSFQQIAALASILIQNAIAGPGSSLCAPLVCIFPIFEVPLGVEFEIKVPED